MMDVTSATKTTIVTRRGLQVDLRVVPYEAWGAALFTLLEDSLSRDFSYWRAAIGAVILLLVLAFPRGIAGYLKP